MTTVARVARGGWDVESASTPIANRARIEQVETNVDAPTTPEMLFDSALELRHESGVALRFEAEDALREWVKLGLPAIEVAAAKTWRRSHVERFGDASIAATRDARGGEGVEHECGRRGRRRVTARTVDDVVEYDGAKRRVRLDVYDAVRRHGDDDERFESPATDVGAHRQTH